MIGPVLDGIEKEKTDIKVCKVNVDDAPSLATDFGVVSIPHTFVIKNGEKTKDQVGYMTKEELLNLVK